MHIKNNNLRQINNLYSLLSIHFTIILKNIIFYFSIECIEYCLVKWIKLRLNLNIQINVIFYNLQVILKFNFLFVLNV